MKVMILTDASSAVPEDERGEWDIWGVNDGHIAHPYVDVLFHLHKRDLIQPRVIEWANAGGWLYTIEQFDGITSNTYPITEVANMLTVGSRYFTGSITYMIALAVSGLHCGVDTLRLHGVYAMNASEYRHQRACLEFWTGVAVGSGINVELTGGTRLTEAGCLYGYDDGT